MNILSILFFYSLFSLDDSPLSLVYIYLYPSHFSQLLNEHFKSWFLHLTHYLSFAQQPSPNTHSSHHYCIDVYVCSEILFCSFSLNRLSYAFRNVNVFSTPSIAFSRHYVAWKNKGALSSKVHEFIASTASIRTWYKDWAIWGLSQRLTIDHPYWPWPQSQTCYIIICISIEFPLPKSGSVLWMYSCTTLHPMTKTSHHGTSLQPGNHWKKH